MPDYNYTVTVSANTSKDDPKVVEMMLCKGTIASGEIYFPPGCVGLCHVTICNGSGQLWPANREDSFHYDNLAVPLIGRYRLDTAPYKLYIKAWNLDDTYSHEPQIHLAVLPEEEVTPWQVLRDFISILKKLIGL